LREGAGAAGPQSFERGWDPSGREPRSPGLDLDRLHRKALRVHGAAEYAGNLDQVAAEMGTGSALVAIRMWNIYNAIK